MTRFRSLAVLDLDGTLVGDAAALARLNAALAARRRDIGLVYATGRGLASALALADREGLLAPDWIAADVGTVLYRGPEWSYDAGWQARLQAGWSEGRVRAVASFFTELKPQPAGSQGPFKCSFFLTPERASRTIARLGAALRQQRLSATIAYSSDRDLDILPARGGKGHALLYLATLHGLGLDAVFACGDSGNDAAMLATGCRAAMTGNALPELAGLPTSVYRAAAPYAGGVHEALRHYGWVE